MREAGRVAPVKAPRTLAAGTMTLAGSVPARSCSGATRTHLHTSCVAVLPNATEAGHALGQSKFTASRELIISTSMRNFLQTPLHKLEKCDLSGMPKI
jgi:hypothetical protein